VLDSFQGVGDHATLYNFKVNLIPSLIHVLSVIHPSKYIYIHTQASIILGVPEKFIVDRGFYPRLLYGWLYVFMLGGVMSYHLIFQSIRNWLTTFSRIVVAHRNLKVESLFWWQGLAMFSGGCASYSGRPWMSHVYAGELCSDLSLPNEHNFSHSSGLFVFFFWYRYQTSVLTSGRWTFVTSHISPHQISLCHTDDFL